MVLNRNGEKAIYIPFVYGMKYRIIQGSSIADQNSIRLFSVGRQEDSCISDSELDRTASGDIPMESEVIAEYVKSISEMQRK